MAKDYNEISDDVKKYVCNKYDDIMNLEQYE